MKKHVHRKIYVDITLDSSELVMLNKGSKHSISIDNSDFLWSDENGDAEGTSIEFSFQLEGGHLGRFGHVTQHGV